MITSFEPINVTDIVGYDTCTQDPARTVGEYFGRLIDALFNRPVEILESNEVAFTKTEIRQMYKRAYPKAKV